MDPENSTTEQIKGVKITRFAGWLVVIGAGAGALFSAAMQRFDAYPEELSYVFPGLIFLGLLPVGCVMAFGTKARGDDVADDRDLHRQSLDLKRFTVVAGLAWGYVAATALVGFPLATFLFQAAVFGAVFNSRRALWLLGAPLIATTVFTLFFRFVLSVPLPRGIGVFYYLNGMII